MESAAHIDKLIITLLTIVIVILVFVIYLRALILHHATALLLMIDL